MRCDLFDKHGTVLCRRCRVPYKLSERERQLWGGNLAKIVRECPRSTPTELDQPKPARAERQAPPLLSRIGNFTKAAIAHAMNGAPTCSDEEIAERHAICRGCELYQPDQHAPDVGVCTHKDCGCSIKMARRFVSKLAWADEQCPLGKWPALS